LKQQLIGMASGLVVGLLALVLLLAGPLSQQTAIDPGVNPEQSQSAEGTPAPSEEPAEVEPTLEPCSVAELEASSGILQLQAQVLDAATGNVLFDRSSQVSARAASVQKLLTAAVALKVLGPDYTAITRVYQDKTDKGKLYFVGGGDVTLSRTPEGKQSVYRNAPKLEVLADSVLRKLRTQEITEIVLDSSLYGGASGEYQSVWDQRGLTDGYMSYVSALQVDGDRDNPAGLTSARSKDPVGRAGTWFKEALGTSASEAKLTKGVASADAVEIAQISSRPISEWIGYMLVVSDNALAESMARLVSLDLGLDGSSASFTEAFRLGLAGTGLDLSSIKIEDGSGLSRYNQISPDLVNDLLILINQPSSDFEIIKSAMPVAGESGSLSGRFVGLEGKVVAKTGWIRTGYTLAGFAQAADGSELIFTVYNLGDSVGVENREAMDLLVAGFQSCGLALTN
jgi:D-alanyl-D-alanine carboxypeptidase/D-alanyl-D-alanine-endopeptidase (penicillin-binding protein 4)